MGQIGRAGRVNVKPAGQVAQAARLFSRRACSLCRAAFEGRHGYSVVWSTPFGLTALSPSGEQDCRLSRKIDLDCLISYHNAFPHGGIAQLGERLDGIEKVRGSSPLTSTWLVEKSIGKEHRGLELQHSGLFLFPARCRNSHRRNYGNRIGLRRQQQPWRNGYHGRPWATGAGLRGQLRKACARSVFAM